MAFEPCIGESWCRSAAGQFEWLGDNDMSILFYELIIDTTDTDQPLKYNSNSRNYFKFMDNKKIVKNFYVRHGIVADSINQQDLEYNKLIEGSKEYEDSEYSRASIYIRIDN